MRFPSLACAIALFGFAAAQAIAAPIISGNFVGGRPVDGGDSVTSTAGVISVGNWNNITGNAGGPVGLIDDSGAVSGATITWTSPNTWSATGAAPGGGGNESLMSGYLDIGGSGSATFTVSDLPSQFTQNGYDVYVYFNADNAGVQGYTGSDNAGNTDTAFGRQAGAGNNYPLIGPDAIDGFIVSEYESNDGANTPAANVVLLTGFFGSEFTLLGVDASDVSGDRARPNGFQIVANPAVVPEPASLAAWLLSAIAVLGMLWIRRNRRR